VPYTWCASEELIPRGIAMELKTVVGLQRDRTAAREVHAIELGPLDRSWLVDLS
jgi:hypothetical protein